MVVAVVRDVMTRRFATVRVGAGYREIIDALVRHEVGAIPVVDKAGRVLGVVSEADLLSDLARAGGAAAQAVERPRWHSSGRTPAGHVGWDLRPVPTVTIAPDASAAAAAELMVAMDVERIPVVDGDGRLVGVISRRDLLRAFLRTDRDVRDELAGPVLRRVLARRAPQVKVDVLDGVVTLTGRTDRRSTAQLALDLARAVPGVVDVVDRLGFRYDDTGKARRGVHGQWRGPPMIAAGPNGPGASPGTGERCLAPAAALLSASSVQGERRERLSQPALDRRPPGEPAEPDDRHPVASDLQPTTRTLATASATTCSAAFPTSLGEP